MKLAVRASGWEELRRAARLAPPRAAIVLGSGMGQAIERVRAEVQLQARDVPGLAAPTVSGHAGSICLGSWAGQRVLLLGGRVHDYEGRSRDEITAPIRLAADLGARVLLCTNAAGGIRDDLGPGRLMVLRAHLDCRSLAGWQTPAAFYSARLRRLLLDADQALTEGVYAAVRGPCYETPAEIRALRTCGADAVGMSTAAEIQTGHELGLECAAISLITNRAAGLSAAPIHHGEVLQLAAQAASRLGDRIEAFLMRI